MLPFKAACHGRQGAADRDHLAVRRRVAIGLAEIAAAGDDLAIANDHRAKREIGCRACSIAIRMNFSSSAAACAAAGMDNAGIAGNAAAHAIPARTQASNSAVA